MNYLKYIKESNRLTIRDLAELIPSMNATRIHRVLQLDGKQFDSKVYVKEFNEMKQAQKEIQEL